MKLSFFIISLLCSFTLGAMPRWEPPTTSVQPDMLVVEALNEPDPSEGWTPVGTAEIYDAVFTGQTLTVALCLNPDQPDVLKLEDCWGLGSKPLYIDVSNPDMVTIPYQPTGQYNRSYGSEVYISSVTYEALNHGISPEEFMDFYADRSITFRDGCVNIPVGALLMRFPDSSRKDINGFPISTQYFTVRYESYIALDDGANPWEYMGEGTWLDGICAPMYKVTATEHTVDVYRLRTDHRRFRIDGCWRDVVDTNQPLIIDTTDPECVRIPVQFALIDSSKGRTNIQSYSCYYVDSGRLSMDSFLRKYWNHNITLNNVRLEFPPNTCFFNYPDSSSANFLYVASSPTAGYLILPENCGTMPVKADVETDISSTRYFNMQGMEVAHPVEGQFYIRVNGTKADKVIY